MANLYDSTTGNVIGTVTVTAVAERYKYVYFRDDHRDIVVQFNVTRGCANVKCRVWQEERTVIHEGEPVTYGLNDYCDGESEAYSVASGTSTKTMRMNMPVPSGESPYVTPIEFLGDDALEPLKVKLQGDDCYSDLIEANIGVHNGMFPVPTMTVSVVRCNLNGTASAFGEYLKITNFKATNFYEYTGDWIGHPQTYLDLSRSFEDPMSVLKWDGTAWVEDRSIYPGTFDLYDSTTVMNAATSASGYSENTPSALRNYKLVGGQTGSVRVRYYAQYGGSDPIEQYSAASTFWYGEAWSLHISGCASGGAAIGMQSTATEGNPKFDVNYPSKFYKKIEQSSGGAAFGKSSSGNKFEVGYDADFSQDVDVGGDFSVDGDVSAGGAVEAVGNVSVGGTLTSTGAAYFQGGVGAPLGLKTKLALTNNKSIGSTSSDILTYTATESGLYMFIANIRYATNETGRRATSIEYRSGSTELLIAADTRTAASGNATRANLTAVKDMGAGDAVVLQAAQSSGSNINVEGNSDGNYTYMWVVRLA